MPMFSYPDILFWRSAAVYVDVHDWERGVQKCKEAQEVRKAPSLTKDQLTSETTAKKSKRQSISKDLKLLLSSPTSLYDFYMYCCVKKCPELLEFYCWYVKYAEGCLTTFPQLPATSKPQLESGNTTATYVDHWMMDNDTPAVESTEVYKRLASFIAPVNLQGDRQLTFKRHCTKTEAIASGSTPDQIEESRRAELQAIEYLFLNPGAPKELNLSGKDRNTVLQALETTTDAQCLSKVAQHTLEMLNVLHSQFLKQAKCPRRRRTFKIWA